MAGRDKKKKLRLSDSDSDVFIPEEPSEKSIARWLLRPRILLVLLIVVAGYVVGPRAWSLLPKLAQRPEYRLKAQDICFTESPAWVPRTFLRQVIREGGLPDDLSLLDDKIVDQVASAFQKHPWVERVVSVRKDFPHRLVVTLKYRKPVAVVVIKSDRYPIDRSGVLLPPADLLPNASDLPEIRNARSTPQALPGMPWGDHTIEGAARLAEVLGPSWKKLRLESIQIPDVAGAGADAIYEIRTVGGSRIIWGRAPGTDHPGELTPQQKVGRLEEYETRNGGFSDAHGPYEIDIRHWQEITRRPLADRFENSRQ